MQVTPQVTPYVRAVRLMLAGVLLAAASTAQAQKSKCGPADTLGDDLDRVVEVFTDSALAEFRSQHSIGDLASGAPRAVVVDSRTCGQLAGATRAALRSMYGGKDNPFNDYTFAYFRIGDYYVALQIPDAPPPNMIVSGHVELLIFRMSDLAFVARLLS